ncbi:cation diffusion facilitator family transporter [Candidatus Endoriftia persephone]|uniref:Cadmium, cobalt and zinc/H(+)-K(+) antiporter n=3 Tax=Gammaproteobacteria TaxID=1236 RepID=G2FJ74_9GAMM|nr:cation diffusion facilitator family transporter [Candidatus Endoriftia persephone]EGV50567.1 cadmium, cobalt and zinc/H(+)-K(+) antiporter [endosymbiont of Riftia pachyptila (vent Ph05)]EGW53167.1 cadmium, cobalt and zinc/H(+)-K(+) antiporter [endosymbiont of Tevnia jerichonana (vent Tica)]USF89094.1 cation diffusion facilitator family transporter [Candidatus Endoriftia persephone]
MDHDHQHHDVETMGDRRLAIAIAFNMLLTLAQVIGGVISGSLALIADALHNFSDASSLFIAWVARKIGRQPADHFKTFGYKRAEVIAALINLVTLVLIGFYLIYEAIWRIFEPQVIEGWTVVIVAGIALVVDIATAILTYHMSKTSMNIRAAFLHNVSDALASVGVIIAGALILLYGWYWSDTLLTLLIATYVLYQAATMLPQTLHILMQGTPKDIVIDDVIHAMQQVAGVSNVHHVHIWQLDEYRNALEAHVVTSDVSQMEPTKAALKEVLTQRFSISHSTLEFEITHCAEGREAC